MFKHEKYCITRLCSFCNKIPPKMVYVNVMLISLMLMFMLILCSTVDDLSLDFKTIESHTVMMFQIGKI